MLKEMLLTQDIAKRKEMLQNLKGEQKRNFEQLYRIMGERPVTIRLLDLPVTLPEITEMQTEAVIEAGT